MKSFTTWMKKTIAILSQLLFVFLILAGGLVIFHNLYFTPIKIVGSSMEPTLRNQEFGVMDQSERAINGLQRFDIVIVKQILSDVEDDDENDEKELVKYLIKRLIGLPGETLVFDNLGNLTINNEPVDQPFIPRVGYQDRTCINLNGQGCKPITLDDQSYFLLGDNRGSSTDSRIFGPILRDQLIGQLFAIEGICLGNTTSASNEDPDTCGNRQYIWPRIYA
jgi:signal peptidase I